MHLSSFLNKIFEVFFKGRNKVIDKNELRYIIKSSNKSPSFLIEKLLNYSLAKKDGGARTPNQLSKLFNVINYVFEVKADEIILNNVEESTQCLENIIKVIKKSFKSNLKNQDIKKPNFQIFHNLFMVTNRYLSNYLNKNISLEEKLKESIKKLVSNFQTMSEKVNQLKNIKGKIDELNNKLLI